MEQRLLTADQVAAYLGTSRVRIYRMAQEGILPPPVRLGRRVKWDRHAIDAWIEAGGAGGPSHTGEAA